MSKHPTGYPTSSFQWLPLHEYISKYVTTKEQMLSVVWAQYQPRGLVEDRQAGYPKLKVEERDDGWFVYDSSNFFDYVRDTEQLSSSSSWIMDFTKIEYDTKTEDNKQQQIMRSESEHSLRSNSPQFNPAKAGIDKC